MNGWEARLELGFRREGDRTVLARERQQAPFKVQRAFYPEGPQACHVLVLHNAGGVVGGDRLLLDVALGPGAHAVLSSASAAKVYRSGGPEACQEALARLDAGACLEWLPREAIVFDGARWRLALRVELAADAVFLGSEIVRFGRTARDERFTHGSFRSQLEVWRAGEPLWVERAHLPPAARDGALGLAGQPVVGTLVWAGRPAEPALVAALRALPAPPGAGLTRALAGLVARYRGNDPAAARAWFQALWPVLREASGRPGNPCLPL